MTKTLAERCYQQLQQDIVQGQLQPGERLRMEWLRDHLGVGLSPIREALVQLTRMGLVELESHKGFRVKPLKADEIRDLFHTFTDMELLALRRACKMGDISWEANIAAALHRLGKIVDQQPFCDEWLAHNWEFHRALVAGCNSPTLLRIRDELQLQIDRYCRLSLLLNQQPLALSHKQHQELAAAVLQRDAERACGWLREHYLSNLDQLIEGLL